MLRVRFSETIDKRNRKCGRNDGTDIGTIANIKVRAKCPMNFRETM